MKRTVKLLALLCALVMLLSVLASCKVLDGAAEMITMRTENEEVTLEPTVEPTPTVYVSEDAVQAFDELDLEVFVWYATSDGYSFHMLVDDPANFGIDRSTVPMTLGEFTEEDSVRLGQEAAVYLDKLYTINREELPTETQLSYDVLEQFLIDYSEETDFEYYYEPLTEYSGIHASLPLSFALFELKNVQDVEDYLTLLADTPRYVGQILAYEQKRAELGFFMTESALDAILTACQTIIDSKETSFLYATFNDGIDALNLPDDQAKAYKDRNASLVANEFIGAYVTLYDGLDALRKDCRTYEQASTLNENQKKYYEYSMQGEGCNDLSVEETLEMLKDEFGYLVNDFSSLVNENPDLYNMTDAITSGDTQQDIDYLKTIMAKLLPALPEHNLLITDVPEELQDMSSPAAYVIPALDDWKDNVVYINTKNADPTYLLTLAHECYPGHLYQYVYQRGVEGISRMQKVINFSGYAEGWAQFAEYLVTTNEDRYPKDYVKFNFDYNMMFGAILPAIISILVNYYGYSEEAVQSYVDGLGLYGETVMETFGYYATVVDQPYYHFAYAIGYAQLAQLYRDTRSDLGTNFDINAFLKTYMDLGPAYFGMIKERMDVWSAGVLNDEQ